MHGLLRCPPFVRFICGRMWCRRVLPSTLPAPLSATLSPALWVYLCKRGAAGSASVQTLPVPFVPHSASLSPATATRVLSTRCPSPPLLPVWMCLFSISLVSVPLAVQFSVSSGCARRPSVYLRRHLGSPPIVRKYLFKKLYFYLNLLTPHFSINHLTNI